MKPTPARPLRVSAVRLAAAVLCGHGCIALNAAETPNPPPAAATPAGTPATSPIDTLDQTALQETFRLLRTHYIERDALTLEMLNRAALDGLLERLDFGAELVPVGEVHGGPGGHQAGTNGSSSRPVVAEVVAGGALYVRPAVFALEMIDAFDAALATGGLPPDATLVLDLRTPGPPADFAVAARLLERFVPSGQPLFSVQKPDDPAPRHFRATGTPRWTGPVMVLIDEQSGTIAETVAAVLRAVVKAPLIGGPTPGRTMQYETARISATHALRFASAEMRLPDNASLFRKGLEPDLRVPGDPAGNPAIFERQLSEGVASFLAGTERPRHNEAALVAGTAPELPYLVARGSGKGTPYDTPPVQDRTLQAVIDVLVARRALR